MFNEGIQANLSPNWRAAVDASKLLQSLSDSTAFTLVTTKANRLWFSSPGVKNNRPAPIKGMKISQLRRCPPLIISSIP
jgi:hypothetical protein